MTKTVIVITGDSPVSTEIIRALADAECEVIQVPEGTSIDDIDHPALERYRTISLLEPRRPMRDLAPLFLESQFCYEDTRAHAESFRDVRKQSQHVQRAREQSFKARIRR